MAESIFRAMNRRDFAEVIDFVHEDIILDFPGATRMEGKKKVLLGLRILLRKYPELQFTITEIISENDKVCVVWTNKGRDLKGKPYANSGLSLFHTRDGRIIFISDYFKDTSFVVR
ncbi:MAG: nuclear transport factor 2 family protein [Chlorobi bacterium]|nr:nuclear transport factor 2 family protein [Chlorobiota bacterium]